MYNLFYFLFFLLLTFYLSGFIYFFNEPDVVNLDNRSESEAFIPSLFVHFIEKKTQNLWIGLVLAYTISLSFAFYFGILLIQLVSINANFIIYFFTGLSFFVINSITTKFAAKWAWQKQNPYYYYLVLLLCLIFYPISYLIDHIGKYLHNLLFKKEDYSIRVDIVNNRNMDWLFKESQAGDVYINYDQEITMLQNAMVFSKVRVRDCMIPRTEIEAVEINTPISEAEQKFISTGYSKLAVYEDNLDNILGYINSKDMFKNPVCISDILTQIAFIPETMPANRILHEFMHIHRTFAVVVDEYGGTSGIVTLEDIMEEIFGDIEDEHDTDDLIEKLVRPNEYVLSGRLEIEYLNEKYHLAIPEKEDYDTLAGYILYFTHNLPKPRQVVEIENNTITILKVSNTRIELVLLKHFSD